MGKTSQAIKSKYATVITVDYPTAVKQWAEMKGLEIKNGIIELYKTTNLNGTDFYSGKINYLGKAIAPDWDGTFQGECGCGLHLADSPDGAKLFFGDRSNYLLLLVSAKITDCRCFGGLPDYPMKLRAKQCNFVKVLERVENGIPEA